MNKKEEFDFTETLKDYMKYIYEEEKARTEYIEKKVNVFSFFLSGGIIGVIIKFPDNLFLKVIKINNITGTIIIIIFCISLLLFLLSAIFIILVYKVKIFERLSDAKEFALNATETNMLDNLNNLIISNYVVATNRNYIVNEKKAKNLKYAIFFFLSGLILFTLSMILVNLLQFI